ncbi:MAG: DUF4838 domain-containing protein, partial [Kiritimatiellia bacterium]|nr:DUF4838 domain-containing protein [Kiritimatiellia bacterium]
MPPDAWRARASGRDVCLVGHDADIDPLALFMGSDFGDQTPERRGTLYAVYHLLEERLGVRWLWPGELGTVVPRQDRMVISADWVAEGEPAFRFRRFRVSHINRAVREYDPALARLAFSPEALAAYHRDVHRYLVRHRMGYTHPKPAVGHYFEHWWERFGAEHPDWFMMREEGGRGPRPGASAWELRHVPMCVSNPDLHRHILDVDWEGGDVLRLGEVDVRNFCHCPGCQAWDRRVELPEFAEFHPVVSDRYARFWKTIRAEAVKRNPSVRVTTFLYWNYMPAPAEAMDLAGVYGEYVPWGNRRVVYYPMEPEAHDWNKAQWKRWSEMGVEMAYRPNYLTGGYMMPYLSLRQAADMFRFAARHGMTGYDFDSLWGNWAVLGPALYLHLRLGHDPERNFDGILHEYCSAFGPAADLVKQYFAYWERYSETDAPQGLVNPTTRPGFYPPECFVPARALLDRAEAIVAPGSDEAARIRFLRAGMDHANLCARFIHSLGPEGALPEAPDAFARARENLLELIRFRREHEPEYIADFIAAAGVENRRIAIGALLDGKPGGTGRTDTILLDDWHAREDLENGEPGVIGYETRFSVPDFWRGQAIFLRFESAGSRMHIVLNGEPVGEAVPEAVGGAVLFEVPPGGIRAGRENLLVVRTHSEAGEPGFSGPVRLYLGDDLS